MTMKQDIEAEFEVQLKMISDPSIREKVLETWCKASKTGGWKTIEELRELPFTVLTDSKGISLIQHTKAATEGAIALARIQRENIPTFPHVDMNILVAGALLHDINKVMVFERNEKKVFRNKHALLSEEKHIFPGITLAREAGLPDAIVGVIEYANTVCKHAMATPHNVEAILVHHADITTFDTMNFVNNVSQELGADWVRLTSEVQQSIDRGLPPESEEAQTLAWRWMRLFKETTESNPTLALILRDMQEQETQHRELNGITPEMLAWIAQSFVNARMTLFARHLSSAELEEVRIRQIAHVSDWPRLIAEMRKQYESAAKVSDPAVQALAQQYQDLFRASYCGDDQKLENKVRAVYLHEPDLMLGIGTNLSLNVFVQKAIMFLHRPKHETANAGPKPSAQVVATLRAAHQLLDKPLILEDPIALSILGSEDEAALRDNPEQHNNPMAKALRTSVVVRSRLAEDEWEKSAQNSTGQYVILGAGLDTYAYRSAHHAGRIFEVDLPDTQQWKRDCLATAGIRIPDCLTYVPINFEHSTLEQALSLAGFRKEAPAFFSWLGVAVYLEEEALMNTLRFIATCAPESAVVFDYLIPPSIMTQVERIGFEAISSALAERGEQFKSFLEPVSLADKLISLGFSEANNLSPEHLHERYLSGRTDGLRLGGVSRLMHAIV